MIKSIFCVAISLPLFAMAQERSFTINGKIKNADTKDMIFLSYVLGPNQFVKDSCWVENNKFSLSGKLNGPTRLSLMYNHKGETPLKYYDMVNFYLDGGTVKVRVKDSIKYVSIKGAPLQKEYLAYYKFISGIEKESSKINREIINASKDKDEAKLEKLHIRKKELANKKIQVQEIYISENPDSYFSFLALKELFGKIDITKLENYFSTISGKFKNSPTGLDFKKQIEIYKRTAIGSMAPDFVQNDTNDLPVKLSDFRGKYVLLDFWASWCGPCRSENPNLVRAFHEFKDKNFAVLGISLDMPNKKENWIKAINADKLEWPHISDLKGWENAVAALYGVNAIPQNFLIDPNGKIIASNLKGDRLHKILAEILN